MLGLRVELDSSPGRIAAALRQVQVTILESAQEVDAIPRSELG